MIMIFENQVKSNPNTYLLTTNFYLLYPLPKGYNNTKRKLYK